MFIITLWKNKREDSVEGRIYGSAQRCCDAVSVALNLFDEDNAVVEITTFGNKKVYSVHREIENGFPVKKIVDNRAESPGCA